MLQSCDKSAYYAKPTLIIASKRCCIENLSFIYTQLVGNHRCGNVIYAMQLTGFVNVHAHKEMIII